MARRSIFENEELRKLVDKLFITIENGKPISARKIAKRVKSELNISVSNVAISSYLKKDNKVAVVVAKQELSKDTEKIKKTINESNNIHTTEITEEYVMDVRKALSTSDKTIQDVIDEYSDNPLVVLKALSTRSINAARYGAIFGTDENRKIIELETKYRSMVEVILNSVKKNVNDESILHNINSDLRDIRDEFDNV